MTPEAIDALVAAGVSAEQLAAALKAELLAEQAAAEARRAKARDKKRRQRSRIVPGTDRDSEGQTGTEGDNLPSEVPPKDITQTPLLTSPPEIVRASASAPSDWPKNAHDEFYAAYPRKKAPQDSKRALDKVRQRGVPFERVMAGLRRYVDSEPDPQFIPYPASWLNAGRFDDEPDVLPFRSPGASHGNRPDRQQPSGHHGLALAFARRAGVFDEPGGMAPEDPAGSDERGAFRDRGSGGGPQRLLAAR